MTHTDIYSFVTSEESAYETEYVKVGDNWDFNMREHIQLIFHLKNGMFFTGNNSWETQLRAFKNIMEPLLNLAYWTEDIEVKDVVFYIEDKGSRALSFLVKKYHDEVYVRENNLDTLFDEITESDLDYGGVIVQKTKDPRPEVLKLVKVAFANQTDIKGGPMGLKYAFAPSALRAMSKNGWGSESNGATISINDLIVLATNDSQPAGIETKENRTTGKNIDVYVVRGDLPEAYLEDNDNMEDWYSQVHVIAYYTNEENKRLGVTLYRKKEVDTNLKFFTSKEIENRALGRGVAEGLIHPQIWTNFLEIHKMGMLEAGAKAPLVTDDPSYTQKNRIQEMENLEITTKAPGTSIELIPTISPNNVRLYETSISEWFDHAQLVGSAFDPVLGKEQASGTTFRGQERTVAQGRGLHDRRRGQRAKFIEEIYRDWIIPAMVREIKNGKKFLATLNTEEMTWVVEQMSDCYAYKQQVEDILNGQIPATAEVLKQQFRTEFAKKGNKHLLEILGDEFEGIEIKMGINVAGKQKDLVNLSDKLLSIFQFVFANPAGFQQAMQIPALAKSFGDILEFSGISQVDFSSLMSAPAQLPQGQPQEQPQPSPLQLNAPQVNA